MIETFVANLAGLLPFGYAFGAGAVTANYGIIKIPTSFFLDKEGVIRAVKVGSMTKKAIESQLAEAMK